MSYHILHQFDEQWVRDNGHDEVSRHDDYLQTHGRQRHDPSSSQPKSSQRPWLTIILSLIVAACALYFAMEARRQTSNLQQRITDLETRLNR